MPRNTIMITITTGARWIRNSAKSSWAREPMMMFGGSPISVAVPPMFEASTSAIRYGLGSISSSFAISSVTGVNSSTVVTLSRNAEATAVSAISITMMRNGLPSASFAQRTAAHSNTPVVDRTWTSTIIPINRKITFQSIPK
jgi:hypothetical protein